MMTADHYYKLTMWAFGSGELKTLAQSVSHDNNAALLVGHYLFYAAQELSTMCHKNNVLLFANLIFQNS